MSELQFRHQQAKRKTWLLPLIVIVLLYITIPFLLINKGNDSFKKAIPEIKQNLEKAGNLYNSGVVFTDFGSKFPGFSGWAKSLQKEAKEKIISEYTIACENMRSLPNDKYLQFCDEWAKFAKKTNISLSKCKGVCK